VIPSTHHQRRGYGNAYGGWAQDNWDYYSNRVWDSAVNAPGAIEQGISTVAEQGGQLIQQGVQAVESAYYDTKNWAWDETAGRWVRTVQDVKDTGKKAASTGVWLAAGGVAAAYLLMQGRGRGRRRRNPRRNTAATSTARVIGTGAGLWLMSPFSPEDIAVPVVGTVGGFVAGLALVAFALLTPEEDLRKLTRKLTG